MGGGRHLVSTAGAISALSWGAMILKRWCGSDGQTHPEAGDRSPDGARTNGARSTCCRWTFGRPGALARTSRSSRHPEEKWALGRPESTPSRREPRARPAAARLAAGAPAITYFWIDRRAGGSPASDPDASGRSGERSRGDRLLDRFEARGLAKTFSPPPAAIDRQQDAKKRRQKGRRRRPGVPNCAGPAGPSNRSPAERGHNSRRWARLAKHRLARLWPLCVFASRPLRPNGARAAQA